MKIGIDARVMSLKASGIGRYTLEMVKSLASSEDARNHEFILYPGERTEKINLPANWTYSDRKVTSRGVLRSLIYTWIARMDHLDVFYSSDYLGPVLPMPCRTIITIHDLIPVVYPATTRFMHRLVGNYLVPSSMRIASTVVAVSEATKRDILNCTKTPDRKIKVVYEGKNPSFYPRTNEDNAAQTVRLKYGIGEAPYLFFLGSVEPRKNVSSILNAFSRLYNENDKKYTLVLGGSSVQSNFVLKKNIEQLHLEDNVVLPGFIEDEDLPILLSCARAFCFPSLYEGFGLPVLEAMACGCPVITSNTSSLPEVVGDAALLVDPKSVEHIADAMVRILEDDVLYLDLKRKGIARAEAFTWEDAASRLLSFMTSSE